ncbi:hypothetical protein LINPERHAP1_LOCUS39739 [Linum perenne]
MVVLPSIPTSFCLIALTLDWQDGRLTISLSQAELLSLPRFLTLSHVMLCRQLFCQFLSVTKSTVKSAVSSGARLMVSGSFTMSIGILSVNLRA